MEDRLESELRGLLESLPALGLLPGQLTREEAVRKISAGEMPSHREWTGYELTDAAEEGFLDAMLDDIGGFEDEFLRGSVKAFITEWQAGCWQDGLPEINMYQARMIAHCFQAGYMARSIL